MVVWKLEVVQVMLTHYLAVCPTSWDNMQLNIHEVLNPLVVYVTVNWLARK